MPTLTLMNQNTGREYGGARASKGAHVKRSGLSHVRSEEDAHRVAPVEAAAERVGLLERHLAKCRRRRELLSGS